LRRRPKRLGEKELLWWCSKRGGGLTGSSSRAPGGTGTVSTAAWARAAAAARCAGELAARKSFQEAVATAQARAEAAVCTAITRGHSAPGSHGPTSLLPRLALPAALLLLLAVAAVAALWRLLLLLPSPLPLL
jgi:hypothetical protein